MGDGSFSVSGMGYVACVTLQRCLRRAWLVTHCVRTLLHDDRNIGRVFACNAVPLSRHHRKGILCGFDVEGPRAHKFLRHSAFVTVANVQDRAYTGGKRSLS
jgi:hypothetical protein